MFSHKTSQHIAAGKELAQDTLLRIRPGMMSCGCCRFLKWWYDEVPKNDGLGVPMGTPTLGNLHILNLNWDNWQAIF